MCIFKRKKHERVINVPDGRPAIIYSTDRPVEHDGAVFNASIPKKEAIAMVEKLKEYIAKYEAQKAELINSQINVEEQVQAFREACIKEAELKRTEEIAKIDAILAGLDEIIKQEETVEVAIDETATTITA